MEDAKIRVEFAPARRSQHLGDQTRIDAWLELETTLGPAAVVVEMKYADRFNSRFIDVGQQEKYRSLSVSTGLWDLDEDCAQDREVNQLLRCHALGASVWRAAHPTRRPPLLLLIHHPEDAVALRHAERYRCVVKQPECFRAVGLDLVLGEMSHTASTPSQRTVVDNLVTRYLAHDRSEALWQSYLYLRSANRSRAPRNVSGRP